MFWICKKKKRWKNFGTCWSIACNFWSISCKSWIFNVIASGKIRWKACRCTQKIFQNQGFRTPKLTFDNRRSGMESEFTPHYRGVFLNIWFFKFWKIFEVQLIPDNEMLSICGVHFAYTCPDLIKCSSTLARRRGRGARFLRNGKIIKSAFCRERGATILASGLRPPGAGGPCTPNACGAKAGAPKTPECYDHNF